MYVRIDFFVVYFLLVTVLSLIRSRQNKDRRLYIANLGYVNKIQIYVLSQALDPRSSWRIDKIERVTLVCFAYRGHLVVCSSLPHFGRPGGDWRDEKPLSQVQRLALFMTHKTGKMQTRRRLIIMGQQHGKQDSRSSNRQIERNLVLIRSIRRGQVRGQAKAKWQVLFALA